MGLKKIKFCNSLLVIVLLFYYLFSYSIILIITLGIEKRSKIERNQTTKIKTSTNHIQK